VIELRYRRFHLVDRNIRIAAAAHRIGVAEFTSNAIHVAQFRHRAPTPVALAPSFDTLLAISGDSNTLGNSSGRTSNASSIATIAATAPFAITRRQHAPES